MLRTLVEARALVALAMAGGVGVWGLRAYPVSHDNVFLGLIGERAPGVLSAADATATPRCGSPRRSSPRRC